MRKVLVLLSLFTLPALGQAEDVWRWTDAQGTLHYSNVADRVPSEAEQVKTRIVREVTRLPGADTEMSAVGGEVVDTEEARPAPLRPRKRPTQIYDEERRRRGCYTAGVLYFGGWAHADDISPALNCLPYMYGPEAWLNTAKAELALRRAGISQRDLFGAPAR